jgi:hypothetical protein
MAINPFVELARDPVGTLAWLGYFLFMLGVVVLAVPWAIRKTAWLYARYETNATSDDWWSFGNRRKGYIPPAGWLGQAFLVCVVLAGSAWALGTVVWLLGV